MNISYNWLCNFIKTDLSVEKTSEILTDIGLEVEGTKQIGLSTQDLEHFVVGEIVSIVKHPNADKLKIAQVNLGTETVQIVCGAPNVDNGQKVPVATPGAKIKDEKGNSFAIKKAKLRGEPSNGMICSQKELRISEDNSGIWVMDSILEPGTPLSKVLDTNSDYVFEIGLTPNRADAMSHYGVARDLYAALKARKLSAELIPRTLPTLHISGKVSPINVEIENPDLCNRFCGIYIKGIKVEDSPLWLIKKLSSIGLVPRNNIVDVTNYIMHHLGQPMHAYDADTIDGNQIIVGKSKAEDSFTTLDNTKRILTGDELMIQDSKENLGIAGVMGGLKSSVTIDTTNIFVESAYFNPIIVRKTAKLHNINSDASFRFERGIDPNEVLDALELASSLILELAGGNLEGDFIDVYPNPIKDYNVVLKYNTIDKLLGERLHREKIKEILQLLEIVIISETPILLELEVPSYRVDVTREADLVEEILRIYGFNAINGNEKMSFSIVPGEGYLGDTLENKLAESLVTLGFYEAMNISMYKDSYNEMFGFDQEKSVELLNPLSSDLAIMRRSLLPSLLSNLEYNIKRKEENLKFFEVGKSYTKTNGKYDETKVLSLVITGDQHTVNWANESEEVDIFFLKGIVKHLFKKFKLSEELTWKIEKAAYSEDMMVGQIQGNSIVSIGTFNQNITKNFDLNKSVYFTEIQIDKLMNLYSNLEKLQFQPLPKFPKVKRDLALLIDNTITYQDIQDTIGKLNIATLKGISLFDVYEGDNLPENKKSYAISVSLQDEQKTMKDNQIDEIMKKIIKSLHKELKAELR